VDVFPLITAHTGCEGNLDNSVESVRAGLELGADIIEDDIRMTRDGILVLSHEDRIRLNNASEASLSAMTLRELTESLASPLVELEPVLGLIKAKGKVMNLDLKSNACIEPLSQLIGKLDMYQHAFLTGCEYKRAQAAKRHAPRLPRLLNVDIPSFSGSDYMAAARQACEEALDAGCFGLNVPYPLVTPEFLQLASGFKLPFYIWTVNEAVLMKRYVEMGVRSITTRDVAALQAVKQNWSGETSRE
jgi:glycerophosphoryl diester phosphodiesterase